MNERNRTPIFQCHLGNESCKNLKIIHSILDPCKCLKAEICQFLRLILTTSISADANNPAQMTTEQMRFILPTERLISLHSQYSPLLDGAM